MSAGGLDWRERRDPREWSACCGDIVVCIYPSRDAPVSLVPTLDALTLKGLVFRRQAGAAVLLRTFYADTVVQAKDVAAELLGIAAAPAAPAAAAAVGGAGHGRGPALPGAAEQPGDNARPAAGLRCRAFGCDSEPAPSGDLCGACWHRLPKPLQDELRASRRGAAGHAAVLGRVVAALEAAQYGERLL